MGPAGAEGSWRLGGGRPAQSGGQWFHWVARGRGALGWSRGLQGPRGLVAEGEESSPAARPPGSHSWLCALGCLPCLCLCGDVYTNEHSRVIAK